MSNAGRRRRFSFNLFLALVLFILGSGFVYLGLRLIVPLALPDGLSIVSWVFLGLPFLAILWLPLVHWRRDSVEVSPRHQTMMHLSYGAMGFLSILFFVVMVRDGFWLGLSSIAYGAGAFPSASLTRLPTSLLGPVDLLYGQKGTLGLLVCAIALYGLGRLESWRTPAVRRVEVPIPNLPAALEGFRIAQLSDVHMGPSIRRPFLERVVGRVNELAADVVALTGDIVDGPLAQLKDEVEPFSRLRAREGSFFVTGNHEYYWGAAEWVQEMSRLGIVPLLNQHRIIERGGARLCLAGVPDYWGERRESSDGEAAALPDAAVRILLAHQPKSAFEAAKRGFDLQLSGHTHGGQFLPWTLLIRFFQPFVRGLNRCGAMWLYVSRGTGSWGPPLRLGAPSEITLLTLVNAQSAKRPRIVKSMALA